MKFGRFPGRARPRARSVPGRMNKTEAAYAARLDVLRAAGEILNWRFEALKFRLADRTWYTPDFVVVTAEGFELHEVKGHWEDDARVKWKATADLWPEFRFVAITRKGGAWRFEVYGETATATAASSAVRRTEKGTA